MTDMRTSIRKKVVLPIVCAIAFFGIGAGVQLASADAIGYESVPEAASVPSAGSALPPIPSSIPSTESVPGLYVAAQSSAARKSNEARGYYYATVFGNEAQAKALTAGKPMPSAAVRVCMGQSRDSASDVSVRLSHYIPSPSSSVKKPPVPVRPPMGKSAARPIPPAAKRPSVRLVHMEKLNVEGATVTLDVTDSWVDVLTLGARQISKWSVPMKKISTGPNQLEVFAARSGKTMQVLVRPPSVPLDGVPEKEKKRYTDELESVANHIGVRRADSAGFDTADCGHLRFTLEYDKGSGQMATIVSTAFLPGGVDDEVDDPKPQEPGEGEDEAEPRQLAIRTRLALGNISLTQAPSEKDPMLSVSWGWGTKELIVRF